MDLIYDEPPEVEIGDCLLRVWKTGDPERRGEICITFDDYEVGRVTKSFTPDEARKLAVRILEFASIAERLSTRGFVGSKE